MLCRRLITTRLCTSKIKQPTRSKQTFLYNDDFTIQRPFDNVVKIKIPTTSLSTSTLDIKGILDSRYGPVNAIQFFANSEDDISYHEGYVSFANEQSKYDALNSKIDKSLPFQCAVQNYDHESSMKDNKRKFSSIMVAAFQPSVQDVGKIYMHFLKYGLVNGHQVIRCPYDSDRAFLYCSYLYAENMHAAAAAFSTIPGLSVTKHTADPNSSEDVLVWMFGDTQFLNYGLRVSVWSNLFLYEGLVAEILKYSEQCGEIENFDCFFPHKMSIKFKDHRSVFNMFYKKTWSGRIKKTLQESGGDIYIHTAEVPRVVLNANAIMFTNVPNSRQNILSYISNLLDLAGCNPGIIAINHDDTTNTVWAKLPHPWYVMDVSCKVHEFLNSDNVPEEYLGLGVLKRRPYWHYPDSAPKRDVQELIK